MYKFFPIYSESSYRRGRRAGCANIFTNKGFHTEWKRTPLLSLRGGGVYTQQTIRRDKYLNNEYSLRCQLYCSKSGSRTVRHRKSRCSLLLPTGFLHSFFSFSSAAAADKTRTFDVSDLITHDITRNCCAVGKPKFKPIEKTREERRAETDPTEWLTTATGVNLRPGTWNNKTRQAIRFSFTSEKHHKRITLDGTLTRELLYARL